MGDLQDRLASGLVAVEAQLHQIIASDEPFITEAAAHLIDGMRQDGAQHRDPVPAASR